MLTEDQIRELAGNLRLAEGGRLSYWADHGIHYDTLAQHEIGWSSTRGFYTIPYRNLEAQIIGVHCLNPQRKSGQKGKWAWTEGSTTGLFGIHTATSRAAVILCEGETDTLLLRQQSANAIGLPGCGLMQPNWARDVAGLAYGHEIYVCFDQDVEGQRGAEKCLTLLRQAGVEPKQIHLGVEGWDICDFIAHRSMEQFRALMSKARSVVPGFQVIAPEDYAFPRFPIETALPDSGFIRDYYEYARPTTATPDEFLVFGAMLCLAGVINRRVALRGQDRRLYPNLYMLWAGSSGVARKTSGQVIAQEILHQVPATTMQVTIASRKPDEEPQTVCREVSHILPNDGTPEGLIETMSLEGEHRPFGVFFWGEVSKMFEEGQRKDYMAGWRQFFQEMYDSPISWDRTLKSGVRTIKRPAISICGAIQTEYLLTCVSRQSIYLGFVPRFMLIIPDEERSKKDYGAYPPERAWDARKFLIDYLTLITEIWPPPEHLEQPTFMDISPEARELTEPWMYANEAEARRRSRDNLRGSLIVRCEATMLKLAALYQLSYDPEAPISQDAAERAIELAEHQRAIHDVMLAHRAESTFERLIEQAKQYMLRHDGGIVARRDFYRYLRIRPRELEDVISFLEQTGFFKSVDVELTGGRRPKRDRD